MRIEKCVEDNGRKITVYVDDVTVIAANHAAVRDLTGALLDAINADNRYRDSSQKETIEWHSVEESLPEEGEYVLGATQSLVVFTRFEDGKFCSCGVKYWSKLPSVPHS